ncbi:hypothetical protein D6817_05680 [Candidatus Pacearchaeota archaeon]|nr:MAG: hypothetical protein D6817_05680 [Candidatus Pacearchaeota archaeon]
MGKRGQVTAFVIIAALIIIIGVVLYFVFPSVKVAITSDQSPHQFLASCLKPQLEYAISTLEKQGGYLAPEGFVVYNNTPIKFLCYTSEYFRSCVVQQPALLSHLQKEIKSHISSSARDCYDALKEEFESRGYRVSKSGEPSVEVSIVPDRVEVSTDFPVTLSKEASTNVGEVKIAKESGLYDFAILATSIVRLESSLGNADTTLYSRLYPNIIVEKVTLGSEGASAKIYTIKNVVTGESFRFATRSQVWAPGYGLS